MKIDNAKLEPIARQIEKIYRRLRKLEQEKARASGDIGLRAVTFAEMGDEPVRSRLEDVDDAITGLRYAVWNIGLTVAAIGGAEALNELFSIVEASDPNSTKIASWLDHRWDGVPIGNGVWTA